MSGAVTVFTGIKGIRKNAEIQTAFVFITDGASPIGSVPEESGGHNKRLQCGGGIGRRRGT